MEAVESLWRPLKGRAGKSEDTWRYCWTLHCRSCALALFTSWPGCRFGKVNKCDHVWRESFIFWYESPFAVMQERETQSSRPDMCGSLFAERSMGSCWAQRREEIKHTGRGQQTSQGLSDVYTSNGFHHTPTHTHKQGADPRAASRPARLPSTMSQLVKRRQSKAWQFTQTAADRFPVGIISNTKTSS